MNGSTARRAALALRDLGRHERSQLAVVGDEAVLVVGLELAAVAGDVRGGVRPADETLEEREAPEHPARAVVGRHDRMSHPEPSEAVARLETAGPAAHDDDVVVAGRMRANVYCHVFESRSLRASACSIRSITVGRSRRKGSSSGPGSERHRRRVSARMSATGTPPVRAEISPK